MLHLESLRQRFRSLAAKPCHEARILRAWLNAKPLPFDENLPRPLREAMPLIDAQLTELVTVYSEHPSADGALRLLLKLADGQMIESVLLKRDGLCVSSQVGCAVACAFCMTGRAGLQRQLSSAEILAQVVLARQRRAVKKVVFMGMGEPAHNLDNVLTAIEALGQEGNIGHKNLVLSTVGDHRVFERLMALPRGTVRPALALSLHTTDPDLRSRLLPNAPLIPPGELIHLAETYARASGYPVQYQWTLLRGINDTPLEIERLAALMQGRYAMVNFILYNPTEGLRFERPAVEHAQSLIRQLRAHQIVACLRDSVGQDVEGACGQLRARHLDSPLSKIKTK